MKMTCEIGGVRYGVQVVPTAEGMRAAVEVLIAEARRNGDIEHDSTPSWWWREAIGTNEEEK